MNHDLTKIAREVEGQRMKYTMSQTDLDKLNYINMHKRPLDKFSCDDEISDITIFAGACLLFVLACVATAFFFTI